MGKSAIEREKKEARVWRLGIVGFLQFMADLVQDNLGSPDLLRHTPMKMIVAASIFALIAISHKILPASTHRLITDPQEWDSIIVSSDPIKIREKSYNDSTQENEIPKQRKRSYEDCPENDFGCLYGPKDNAEIVDKFLEKYSHLPDVNYSGEENDNSRKSYWTMVDSQTHNHPYEDKNGWVTLEPVPWSTSKISKWHPNKVGVQQERPWGYESGPQASVQQFWVSGSTYQPQGPSWAVGTNDIITDNKPSDFPPTHIQGYQGVQSQPEHGYGYPQAQNIYSNKGDYPPRYPQNTLPSTYPNYGNGEWILLSTTKGYSHPHRHRWSGQKDIERISNSRKIRPTDISKYHEEDLEDKSAEKEPEKTNVGGNETNDGKAPIQILYTGPPKNDEQVKTMRRKVRLQVLPSLETSSISYGGLLEVDSNSETVDEAQQQDEKLKKLATIANVKKNKIRGYKLVPTSKITGKKMMQENVMTLAAVGAGMIPATMALLVPMALGRRKRNVRSVKRDFLY